MTISLARRLACWESLIGIPAAVAVAAYLVPRLPNSLHKTVVIAAVAAYVGFVVWLSGRSRDERVVAVLCQVALLLGMYGAEFYIANLIYDRSSLLAQATRMRAEGKDAWPAIPAAYWYLESFRADIDAGRSVLPLAGLSSVTSVMCRETEGWVTFDADSFGFRNPPRHSRAENFDVVLIGDSFAEGTCVNDEHTIAAHLRNSGLSVLNLGMHGSGPLFELAILQEYALRPHVRRVIWLFFEGNDIYDLGREGESTLLQRYLTDGPFQALERRQAEVDATLRNNLFRYDLRFAPRNIAQLKEVRAVLGIVGVGQGSDRRPAVAPRLPLLAEVFARARKFVEAKGARLSVVYLPTPTRFEKRGDDPAYFATMESFVSELVCRSGLDLVSVPRVFERTHDPLSQYAYLDGQYGHFEKRGYRVVSEELLDYLTGRRESDCPTQSR